jgi:hypothetical protein
MGPEFDMTPYPLTMQLKMTRLNGHVFLAPGKLYFVCSKKGGAWGQAIGAGVGGLVGGLIAAAVSSKPGEAPPAFDEASLQQACTEHEGSLIMEAGNIQAIKYTWMWRFLKYDKKTYGLPNGISKPLAKVLAPWAAAHNVLTKGLG